MPKPVAKHTPPAAKPININSVCNSGSDKHVNIVVGESIQFKAPASKSFGLSIKGGLFDGYPIDFCLPIVGNTPQPAAPLVAIAAGKITNYIFDNSGKACVNKKILAPDDEAPDIVISSGLRKGSKTSKK